MFKLVKNDTHWLAFGVSETLIVAQAVDLKNLAGFRDLLLTPHTIIEVLHYNCGTDICRLKIQKA